jgi:GMP synthase (glutamine-hydrolysing)
MPTALVVRHIAFEDLGLFEAPLTELGFQIKTLDAGVHPISDALISADFAVICGGPIGVYETDRYPFLNEELGALRVRLRAEKPTLGLCLGAQLMAAALGARVYPGGKKELGWGDIQLTPAGAESPLAVLHQKPILHWHGDTFDLPFGAELLASTDVYPHQAFSLGSRLLALQFHAEADPARIEQWLIGHTMELGAAGISVPELRAETARLAPALPKTAREFIRQYVAGW